jgi:hypothetical protein
MPHSNPRRRARQIETLRTQFAQADGLPFADILSADRIDRAARQEGASWREVVYTPVLTLWAFLSQVLSADGSCRAVVLRVLAWLVSRDEQPCTPQTGPYCKARQRLPEALLRRRPRETGRGLHDAAPEGWRWRGRRVKIAGGSTVSMPDTPANQHAYPQSRSQKPGVGFPLARLVVVFCLACGTVLDAALGPSKGKKTGEAALLRTLTGVLAPGDVLLGDRCFSGYCGLARSHRDGVDTVARRHQRRRSDYGRGRRLGRGGYLVTWRKPAQRPAWLDAAAFAALPPTLTVREVTVRVRQPGFRTRSLVVVTTLRDATAYPAWALAALYRARWQAELDLRSLKAVLGLDVLRCHSPELVRKEVWAHLLAYNLIRTVMAQAALDLGAAPRQLSFTGALQAVRAFAERLHEAPGPRAEALLTWLWIAVGAHQVGDRPDRSEPRKRKRREKHSPLLNEPRDKAREALLN